jgi:transcriptional regulator with XRE-family HTH domain
MRERTPFGERLFLARTHAKLSQTQLAKAAGVSQGNLGELEWNGESSMAVVRIAAACGVRPEWLADGKGEMIDKFAWPFTLVSRDEIAVLTEAQLGMVEGAMVATLERIHSPNAEDLQAFNERPARKVKKTSQRKRA